MPLSNPGTATADLTNHPIIETFTQAGWTFDEERSRFEGPGSLLFKRWTKCGICLEILYFIDPGDAAVFIEGADNGTERFAPTVALQEADRFVEANIFRGWE